MSVAAPDEGLGAAAIGALRGVRDLLPPTAQARRELERRLVDRFRAWGFQPVATPVLERFDVLARGLSPAAQRACVRFVAAGSGELVSLRADVTPQIARMVGEHLGGELDARGVHRFCYAAEVVRQPASDREPAAVYQVGVELVGDGHACADAELVMLAGAALREVGLSSFSIDLAHARLVTRALEDLAVEPAIAAQVRAALRVKDRDGVRDRLESHGHVAQAIAGLCDRYGGPSVLAADDLSALGPGAQACITELAAVVELVHRLEAADARTPLTVDLGEVRGFDYYSGVRLRGWAPGVARAVIKGGRYDDLVGRYGPARAATGFAIDLDALFEALAFADVVLAGREDDDTHLVVVPGGEGARARAAALVARLRVAGRRTWVEPGLAVDDALALGRRHGAAWITVLDEQGPPRTLRLGPQGYQLHSEGEP